MTVLNSTKVKRATEKCLLTEFATGGACVWRLCYVVGACKYHPTMGVDLCGGL